MKKSIPTLYKNLGQNLRDIRQNACLSQNKLGQALGVSYQQIQKYEKGINRLPAEHIYTLKHALDIPYEHFFQCQSLPQEGHNATEKDYKITEKFIRKLEKIDDKTLKTKALRVLTILME